MEGVPDRDSYYLIGLLAVQGDEVRVSRLLGGRPEDEARMWEGFVDRVASFPDAPIYHYGSYERKAFETLAKRHGKGQELSDRLVNVASSVYGRVYFPVRSNGLKVLGGFLGATWTAPRRRGCRAWSGVTGGRRRRTSSTRQALLRYNREDCEAVRVLVARLVQIRETAASEPAVDFAHRPKQTATEAGKAVHRQFERILRDAQEDRSARAVRIRAERRGGSRAQEEGGPKGHQAYQRIIPSKAGRTVRADPKRRCPRGHGRPRADGRGRSAERTVIDLVFTRSGCRKTVTRYTGKKATARSATTTTTRLPLAGICRHRSGTPSRPGPSTSGSSSACPTASSPR